MTCLVCGAPLFGVRYGVLPGRYACLDCHVNRDQWEDVRLGAYGIPKR
jgi:hypothetical protein